MSRVDLRLQTLLEPTVSGLGYELVGVVMDRSQGRPIMCVYIDREEGIGIADCEKVSRQVSALLDVEEPVKGEYDLEVSSPGLDRPLFFERDFVRFCGETVKLRFASAVAGRRRLTGRLLECRDGELVVDEDGEEHRIRLDQIDRANLVPAW